MDDLNGILGLEAFHEEIQVSNPLYDTELVTSFLDEFSNVEFVLDDNTRTNLNTDIFNADSVETSESSSNSPNGYSLNNQQIKSTTWTDNHDQRQMKILCPICKEGDAGRHKHYGGTACISCRAFFRRSIQRRSNAA